MRKNIFYLIFNLIILLSSQVAYSSAKEICQEVHDKIFCSTGVIDQANYISDVEFNGITVLGKTKILGNVKAVNSNFNALEIIGDSKITDSQIRGNAKILGNVDFSHLIFSANLNLTGDIKGKQIHFIGYTKIVGDIAMENVMFDSDLIITSADIKLLSSTTKNIEFMPNSNQQILSLKNTTINGSIIFSSNNGIIYSSDSVINGKIIGGKVIYQD